MECKRCGAWEDRIDGYCSNYCRDMADIEKERDDAKRDRDRLQAQLTQTEKQLKALLDPRKTVPPEWSR